MLKDRIAIDRKYWIAIPKLENEIVHTKTYTKKNGEQSIYKLNIPRVSNGSIWEWYKMPKDVYDNKEYPTCKCGKKYVPIKDMDKTRCFSCIFTNKNY